MVSGMTCKSVTYSGLFLMDCRSNGTAAKSMENYNRSTHGCCRAATTNHNPFLGSANPFGSILVQARVRKPATGDQSISDLALSATSPLSAPLQMVRNAQTQKHRGPMLRVGRHDTASSVCLHPYIAATGNGSTGSYRKFCTISIPSMYTPLSAPLQGPISLICSCMLTIHSVLNERATQGAR